MNETTTAITPTLPTDLTPEYQQAINLHNQIVGNIEAAGVAMISMCRNLKQMRDTRLYSQLGYESFEDYTEKAVGLKRRQAYNYITVLESLPTHLLQSNAHLGITKLELLSRVPVLEREDVVTEYELEGLSTRELRELVDKYKMQGEQLSMLQEEKETLERENTSLYDKNDELVREQQENASLQDKYEQLSNVSFDEAKAEGEISKLRDELYEAQARVEELQSKPIDVAVQEPDEETLADIRAAAKADAEKELSAKIKNAEKAAMKKAEEAAQVRFQANLAALEAEKAQALTRAEDLSRQMKAAGNSDITALSLYFDEINKYYERIAGLVEKNRTDDAETAAKFKNALIRALQKMVEAAEVL